MKWLLVFLIAVTALFAAGVLWLAREAPAPAVPIPADATIVLDDARFRPPDGWQWERLDTGAASVRWGHSGPESPRAIVMFLPGYSAPLEIYFETFSRLNEAATPGCRGCWSACRWARSLARACCRTRVVTGRPH